MTYKRNYDVLQLEQPRTFRVFVAFLYARDIPEEPFNLGAMMKGAVFAARCWHSLSSNHHVGV